MSIQSFNNQLCVSHVLLVLGKRLWKSNAGVLMFFLCTCHCLWGFCVRLRFGMHDFMSFLVCNHLDEEDRASCFAFIVFWMSCYCKCPVALPNGAMNWYAVCDCGIS